MSVFTAFDPALHSEATVLSSLLVSASGVSLVDGSFSLRYGMVYDYTLSPVAAPSYNVSSLSFYDGSLTVLGIDAGLLLSTGSGVPELTNTSSSKTGSFSETVGGDTADPELQTIANQAFSGAGVVEDTTSLAFNFDVTDPNVRGLRFDVVFGSDEYPEYKDSSYVDIAAVMVNGANYALFNQQIDQPLSVISKNLELGNFRDNTGNTLPIEYDGVSNVLSVVAPVQQGLNSIKIAVADTGDQAYDSGLFVSNLQAVDFAGFGLAPVVNVGANTPGLSTGNQLGDAAGNQVYGFDDGFNGVLSFGPSTGEGGDDVVDGAGAFVTVDFDMPLSGVSSFKLLNDGIEVVSPFGTKVLTDVERIALDDALFAFDTQSGDATWEAFALLQAGFGNAPSTETLTQWVKVADQVSGMDVLAQEMIDYYAPGISTDALVTYLFEVLLGTPPMPAQLEEFVSQVGPGKMFATQGALLSFAANIEEINSMAAITGQPVLLDLAQYPDLL